MSKNITTRNLEVRSYIANNDSERLAEYCLSLPYGSILQVVSLDDVGVEILHQLQIILQALGNNTSITAIDLAANNISDQGMKLLSQALLENITLRTLDVEDNDITSASKGAIIDLLQNSYIEELSVRGSIDQAIAPLLKENRLINLFIDSLKQNVSFNAGINIGYLMPYFDLTLQARKKINNKLSQEKVVD